MALLARIRGLQMAQAQLVEYTAVADLLALAETKPPATQAFTVRMRVLGVKAINRGCTVTLIDHDESPFEEVVAGMMSLPETIAKTVQFRLVVWQGATNDPRFAIGRVLHARNVANLSYEYGDLSACVRIRDLPVEEVAP